MRAPASGQRAPHSATTLPCSYQDNSCFGTTVNPFKPKWFKKRVTDETDRIEGPAGATLRIGCGPQGGALGRGAPSEVLARSPPSGGSDGARQRKPRSGLPRATRPRDGIAGGRS